jgi:autophagy-related protein 101
MSATTFSRAPYLTFHHPLIPDRQAFNATLASSLTKTIHTMLTHTSSERGRSAVPLITNAAGISPFPIKVTVRVGDVEVG